MRKYLAYIIIAVITLLMTGMRMMLLPQWTPWHHAGAFLFQFVSTVLLWWIMLALNGVMDKWLPYTGGVVRRIIIQILASVICTSPILIAVDVLTNIFFPPLDFMGPQFKAMAAVFFILAVAFICTSFYAAYFFRQWKQSVEERTNFQLRAAEADKERSIVQYQHLKNQVNPHFLFNTLTSLDGLIQTEPSVASVFVRHLAKVYRYVLQHPENEIVQLSAEIDFIGHYISVLNIRYGDDLKISIDVDEAAQEKGIAMVTLQMLIDNAIKHNIVHAQQPLNIQIFNDEKFIIVVNNKQLRKQIEISTKEGLKHLQQLYKYLSSDPVAITDNEKVFEVKIPLL